MEALQMLKFFLKKECLNFTLAWMTELTDLSTDNPDIDLLDELLKVKSVDGHNDIQDRIMQYMQQYKGPDEVKRGGT
jgi:hypothetical protein